MVQRWKDCREVTNIGLQSIKKNYSRPIPGLQSINIRIDHDHKIQHQSHKSSLKYKSYKDVQLFRSSILILTGPAFDIDSFLLDTIGLLGNRDPAKEGCIAITVG